MITKVNELRKSFLDFYEKKDHYVSKSASLIPEDDNSILLIGAGMAPLKKYFTGVVKPPKPRMATCQKCIRVVDIDNVGNTARHMTFFEMLGNFSFGDYFKRESIKYGLEFLTEVIKLDIDKLWVSVYEKDDEAYNIWVDEIGFPEERVVRLPEEHNFWEIGLGPCGPCSEIYYDRGEEYGCGDKNHKPGCDCDQFIEIWNHVFTQYNKLESGEYAPLKNKNIDTGMGLERLAMIVQKVPSVYDIDNLVAIRNMVLELSNYKYNSSVKGDRSVKIVVDHIRSITFMICDGIVPSNESRGYVLRKLIRRASLEMHNLGVKENKLSKVADVVIKEHLDGYPELADRKDVIINTIEVEDERFSKTLSKGLILIDNYIEELEKSGKKTLSGENAFKLYDTYGFPVSLTEEILSEKNIDVDMVGFEEMMKIQRKTSKKNVDNSSSSWQSEIKKELSKYDNTKFIGYSNLKTHSEILSIIAEDRIVSSTKGGKSISIVTIETPFYATSGGQVFDIGKVYNDNFSADVIEVKKDNGLFFHKLDNLSGKLNVNDEVHLEVDFKNRFDTARNHTATHLLHAALQKVLGENAKQAGSLVDANKLRFDFNYFKSLSEEQLHEIEDMVNQKILEAVDVTTELMPLDEAKKSGANALFSEKYDDIVRVVSIGEYSKELCGGTHLRNTSEVGLFKIQYERSIASGIRRIEAITGTKAFIQSKSNSLILKKITQELKCDKDDITDKIESLKNENKLLESELKKIKEKMNIEKAKDLECNVIEGIKVYSKVFENIDSNSLKNMAFKITDKEDDAFVIFASIVDSSATMCACSGKKAIEKNFRAGAILSNIARKANGGGGGRDNFASAGSKDIDTTKNTFSKLDEYIKALV